MKLIIEKTIQIQAPLEKVWEALTNPEMTKQYMFNYEVLSDWQIKSDIIWKSGENDKVYAKGKIINIIPGKIIEYTITTNSENASSTPDYTIVTNELIFEKNYTILLTTQGNFADLINGEEQYKKEIKKWDLSLKQLKKLVEST